MIAGLTVAGLAAGAAVVAAHRAPPASTVGERTFEGSKYEASALSSCERRGLVGPGFESSSAQRDRLGANVVLVYDFTTRMGVALRCPTELAARVFATDTERAQQVAETLVEAKPSSTPLEGEQACDAGNAQACFDMADHHAAVGDSDAEKKYRTRACDGGLPLACFIRARMQNDEAPWRRRGLALLEDQCSQGTAPACTMAAIILRDGLGLPATPTRATQLLQRACALGVEPACT